MKKLLIVKSILIVSIFVICLSKTSSQAKNMNCDFWQSKVNPKIQHVSHGRKESVTLDMKTLLNKEHKIVENKPFDDIDEKETYSIIECFLDLEGNKNDSSLSGATRPDTSQIFGTTTIEVAALYYVSYIFYQKWDHAGAPFLESGSGGNLNSNETVSLAFNAYKEWFKKVKKVGLKEARKQKLDPLDGSGVRWY